MRITYKGDYALKTLLELARVAAGQVITISDLSVKLDIPQKFLEQVLTDLRKGGFVQSRRGKHGGYVLARSADEISVGDIVNLIDHPVEPIACVNCEYKGCRDMATCAFRPLFVEAHEAVSRILDGATLGSLLRKSREQQIGFDI